MNSMIRKSIAEAIGTFVLVFAGTSAIVVNATHDGVLGHLGVAFAFAFAILVMVYAVGHISGGHFNPSVTIGLSAVGKLDLALTIPYLVAQVAGAVIASLAVRGIYGDVADLGASVPAGSVGDAFWAELIATFVLVFVISGAATDRRSPAAATGLAIGGAILLGALWSGPISGGSFNPARTLGPAIVGNTWTDIWVYLTAPIIGGLIGAFAYAAIQREDMAQTAAEGESLPDAT